MTFSQHLFRHLIENGKCCNILGLHFVRQYCYRGLTCVRVRRKSLSFLNVYEQVTPRWDSTEELPIHTHTASITTASLTGEYCPQNDYGPISKNQSGYANGILSKGSSKGNTPQGAVGIGSYVLKINASHSHTISLGNVGGGNTHENRQPYIVVYRFRRIS